MIVVLLAVLAAAACGYGARQIYPAILKPQNGDVWFDSDAPRVFGGITQIHRIHCRFSRRAALHPLFYLVASPPVHALKQLPGLDPIRAVSAVMAVVAAFWLGTFFVLLRWMGCHRPDALLFSLLGAASAGVMFMFPVPESFPFGSLSILLCLAILARTQHRPVSEPWFALGSALTLGFTLTNWMVGLLAVFIHLPMRRAVRNSLGVLLAVVTLLALQRVVFSSGFASSPLAERTAVAIPSAREAVRSSQGFLLHSMVMPSFQMDASDARTLPLLGVHFSAPGSGSGWGRAAVALWLALLLVGVWALFALDRLRGLRWVIGLSILGQLLLHLLYRWPAFLFSAHYVPLLVLVAAFSTLTRARPAALVLGVGLLVTAGINNVSLFGRATRLANPPGSTLPGSRVRAGGQLPAARLANADLQGADLFSANLRAADLRGADLRNADLQQADLRGANLQGADLRGARLAGAVLDGRTHVDARWRLVRDLLTQGYRGQNLRHADLSGAHLDGADLAGASLQGANLSGASLNGVSLQGADLQNADLAGASLADRWLGWHTDLTGANLRGARSNEGTRWPASFNPPR